MSMKLNAEQQKIVEDNFNLIPFFMHKYNIREEYFDLAMEALCEAVLHYDEERGKLSTIFKIVLKQKLIEEWDKDANYKLHYKGGYSTCQLQSVVQCLDDNDKVTIEDLLENEEPGFDSFQVMHLYKQFKSRQKKRDQELLSELEKGLTVGQIAKKQGISKQAVSRRKMGLQYKFHMCYLKDNPEFKDKMTYGVYR